MSHHASAAADLLQIFPESILALASAGRIDLNQQAARELASRGRDQHGNWIGFSLARDALEARQPALTAAIGEHISRHLVLSLEAAIETHRSSVTLAMPQTAAHMRSQSIGSAAELFALADFLGLAETSQCLRERWA